MARNRSESNSKHLTLVDPVPKPPHRAKTIMALFTLVGFLFLMFGGFLQLFIR